MKGALLILTLISTMASLSLLADDSASRDYSRADNSALKYDTNTSNLTDQEWKISRQFFHEGKAQRELQEKCGFTKEEDQKNFSDNQMKNQEACQGMDAASDYKMVELLSKAYAMVVGVGGLGSEYKVNAKGKGDDGKRQDYCRFIAVATEAIALFQQQTAQANLENSFSNPENQQIEQLKKAKASHEERSKTAKIQAIGWTASAGCYTATIAASFGSGGLAGGGDWANLGIKASAATFFAIFAWKQVDAHNDYANRVQGMIDKFETKKGNCNPVTERSCYCNQPETENDPKYCFPEIHQRALARNSLRVSCVNDSLQADPKCKCITTNSCFQTAWYSMTSGMNFGEASDTINSFVGDISKGELSGAGRLSSATLAQAAHKKLNSFAKTLEKINSPDNLSASQISDAKLLKNRTSLPQNAALALAAMPNSAMAKSQLEKLKSSLGPSTYLSNYKSPASVSKNSRTMYFDPVTNKPTKRGNSFDFNKALDKLKKKDEGQKGHIMKFADKAQQAAQISKRPDQNIFDIISRRYQVSGRRILEGENP